MASGEGEQLPGVEQQPDVLVTELEFIADRDPSASFYTYTTPKSDTPRPLAAVIREKPGDDQNHLTFFFDNTETTERDETAVAASHAPTHQQQHDLGYSLDDYHGVTEGNRENIEADDYDAAVAELKARLTSDDNDHFEQMDTDEHARALGNRANKALDLARRNAEKLLPAKGVAVGGLRAVVAARQKRAASRNR